MQVFCYIPSVCIDQNAGETSAQVRDQTLKALDRGLRPATVPRNTPGNPVRLDDELIERLKPLKEDMGLAVGRVIGGLMYALHIAGDVRAPGSGVNTLTPNLKGLRPGQVNCLEQAAPMLHSGKIIASECGTGSGKSRLIAHAAAYVLGLRDAGTPPPIPESILTARSMDVDKTPQFLVDYVAASQSTAKERRLREGPSSPRAVIMVAPSVENVSHLIREWLSVRPEIDPGVRWTACVVLGRGQFVSRTALHTLLSESENEYPEIDKWLADGMPSGITQATSYLKKMDPTISALMADLESLTQNCDIKISDAALDEDSPKDEQILYQDLRSKAMTADLVWTTHSMLCLDNMRLAIGDTAALLPQALALFVDEAHQLENSQANMAGKSLSFQRLISVLNDPMWELVRKKDSAKKCLSLVRDVVNQLKDIPNETRLPVSQSGDDYLIGLWGSAQPALTELRETLSKLIKRSEKSSNANGSDIRFMKSARYVERALQALDQIKGDFRGHVEHTPKRGCISFSIGPSSVDKYLISRWAITPTVMLLSGTLHHITASGANFTAVAREMKIPISRFGATSPINPPWLISSPTIITPSQEIFHKYVPPKRDNQDEESLAYWHHECAKAINLASQDSAGGMMVLMTGYDRLAGLASALNSSFPDLTPRLIVQQRQSRLTSSIPIFKAMARAGERPIWLATGSAWTGLDLSDELLSDNEADKDMVLTDLVIPALPFGLQRSTTHISRVSKLGFSVESLATQRLFRQGMGRLIRREGLKNRRIWLLDGRLMHPAAANYTAEMRSMINKYLFREVFDV